MQVYRITVQKVNADGTLGEVQEIIETERESWSSVFDFVDEYRASYGEIIDSPALSNSDADYRDRD